MSFQTHLNLPENMLGYDGLGNRTRYELDGHQLLRCNVPHQEGVTCAVQASAQQSRDKSRSLLNCRAEQRLYLSPQILNTG